MEDNLINVLGCEGCTQNDSYALVSLKVAEIEIRMWWNMFYPLLFFIYELFIHSLLLISHNSERILSGVDYYEKKGNLDNET